MSRPTGGAGERGIRPIRRYPDTPIGVISEMKTMPPIATPGQLGDRLRRVPGSPFTADASQWGWSWCQRGAGVRIRPGRAAGATARRSDRLKLGPERPLDEHQPQLVTVASLPDAIAHALCLLLNGLSLCFDEPAPVRFHLKEFLLCQPRELLPILLLVGLRKPRQPAAAEPRVVVVAHVDAKTG